MIRLHFYPSTAAMVPHILLEELGVPYERARIDREHGALDSPAYRALNPNGLIPVLEDGDLVLYETAAICRDEDSQPEADSELRDTENVPLGEDVEAFFDREVKPHVPDAWVNETIRDAKDGGIGVVGYEINFNRYFYRYTPPRPLEAIEADIKAVEFDVLKLLKEVAG